MKKSIGHLIDELSITNIKTFYLVDKIKANKHTLEEVKKMQDLNEYRVQLINAINEELNEKEKVVKV